MAELWTAEDVEAAARALAEQREDDVFSNPAFAGEHWDGYRQMYKSDVEPILAVLAERGRLAPTGAVEEWDWGWQHPEEGHVEEKVNEANARWYVNNSLPGTLMRRKLRNWPDGSYWVGPWLPVPPEPTPKEEK